MEILSKYKALAKKFSNPHRYMFKKEEPKCGRP